MGHIGAGPVDLRPAMIISDSKGTGIDPSKVPWWETYALAVEPKYQDTGLGVALLQAVVGAR